MNNNSYSQDDIRKISKYLLEIIEELLTKKIKISSADFNKFLYFKKLEENNEFDLFFSNTYFDDLLNKYKVDMNYIRKGIETIKNSHEPTELFIKIGGDEISFQFQNRQLFFDTLENIQPYNLVEVFGQD